MKNKTTYKVIIAVVLIAMIIIASYFITKNKKIETPQTIEGIANQGSIELQDGIKIANSEKLKQEKNYKNLTINNISIIYENGKSTILADVTNNGKDTEEEQLVWIDILDNNGETLTKVKGIIGKVYPSQTIQINTVITKDITNAYDIQIKERGED